MLGCELQQHLSLRRGEAITVLRLNAEEEAAASEGTDTESDR